MKQDTQQLSLEAPLYNVRVLDLSRILAGPSCTQMLGDLGADVIKVERPEVGDDTRTWGPPYVQDTSATDTSESAYYLCANRNKRSIAIDITQGKGQDLIYSLLAHCDILVENFKVGGLKKYALDYDTLRVRFPNLIYCSITGFGQTGPYADRAGYDFMIQGLGGMMSVTGEDDGMPQKVGVAIADIAAGMYASTGILAALRHRDNGGGGQYIDMALLDAQVALLMNQASNYLTSGKEPSRHGNAHPNIVPYQTFASQDGFINLAIGNDAQFQRFCRAAGCDGLAEDRRFVTNPARVSHRETLVTLLEETIKKYSSQYWIDTLTAAGIPCGPINTLEQVFDNPQVRHRQMTVHMGHPLASQNGIKLVANPIKMSKTPPKYRHPPPILGQHSEQILAEILGFDQAQYDALRRAGVIA